MALIALLSLLGALVLSPYRYFLLPACIVVLLAFIRLKDPALALLALIPYVPLLNLEGLLADTSLYLSEVVLLAALGAVGLRRPGAVRLEGAVWLALAFAGWMAVAALAGSSLSDTARVARLLRTALLAFAAFALGRHAARRLGGTLAWIDAAGGAAAVFALLALGEVALEVVSGTGGGIPRTGSAVGGSELLAIHLTLLAPPAAALVALGGDRSRATRLLLVVVALALAASFSRSGWLGGWAAILGMGLLGGKADRRGARRLIVAGIVIVLVGAGLALGLAFAPGVPGEVSARLRSIANPAELFAGRREEWAEGLATIAAHPLFGHPEAPNPYNVALGLAGMSGLPILALFAALIVAAFRSGLQALNRREAAAPAAGLLAAVIALLVTGMGESSLGARVMPAAFATLGVLSGLGSRSDGAGKHASTRLLGVAKSA